MNKHFLFAVIGSIFLTFAIGIMVVGKPWEPMGPGIPLFLGILFSLLSLKNDNQKVSVFILNEKSETCSEE